MEKTQHSWSQHTKTLEQSFVFPTFLKAIDFVNAVAALSEQHHHHPNITIAYTRVVLSVNTHDAGSIVTHKDHALAAAIDLLYEAYSL